jgi:hypothetical protein
MRIDPAAAGELDDVPDDVPDDAPAGALDVVLEVEEPDDEQPPISAAIAAIATPHTANRVRSSLDMVLIALPPRERPREPIHVEASTTKLRPARLMGNVTSGSWPDQGP